jgi:hypothetical protein
MIETILANMDERKSENLNERINENLNERLSEHKSEHQSEEMSEKTELLDEVNSVINPKKELDFAYFAYVLLFLTFGLMLIFPKIYIQQQIYFKSREVSKLKGEYDTLKEENRLIKSSVESIKFKNQILDTLF